MVNQKNTLKSSKSFSRNPAVEVLRYVGAVGIVWFHLNGPTAWIGHAALEVFIILSVVFALRTGEAWSRRRVLWIWVFWSAVYAAMKIVQAVALGTLVTDEFEWWMLLTGPSLPLWFLPFIYVANGLAVAYVQNVKWPPIVEGIIFGIISSGLVLALKFLPIPLAQWALGFAAVLAAITVFRAMQGNWIALLLWMVPIVLIREELLILAVPIATAALVCTLKTEAIWPSIVGQLALPVYLLHSGVSSVTKLHGSVTGIIAVVFISTILGFVLLRAPVIRSYL